MHPKSRGRIALASAAPAARPVIDGQFLADPEDLETLLRGFKEARRVVHGEAFAKHRPREMLPGPDVRSDDELRAYIRRAAATSFHPAGTCKMGPGSDPAAVVDARLRVHGIEGLRVIDASIMPTICGGNPNAPTIMIGEKGADMIKEDARAGGA
jgi:choline dehydrogenase-like flavoprotein